MCMVMCVSVVVGMYACMHVLMHGNVIMYVYLIKSMPIFIMWVFGYYCGYYMMGACVLFLYI